VGDTWPSPDEESADMSNSLKHQAQALALALEIGAVSVSDVGAWAVAVMAVWVHPHWAVCELATMGASDEPEVVHALRRPVSERRSLSW
jgi:hypothetical protein